MEDLLTHLFSHVCGQNLAHTWSPGEEWLPFCQRCTGLYVGAAMGGLLQYGLRMPPTSRWLQIYGLFLLQMVPFGFHWVPQNDWLRTATGILFGLGLVGFLHIGSAGFQPAGSRISNPPPLRPSNGLPTGSRRYSRLEICATVGGCPRRRLIGLYGLVVLAGIVGIPWSAASSHRWAGTVLTLAGLLGFSLLLGLVAANLFCAFRMLADWVSVMRARFPA